MLLLSIGSYYFGQDANKLVLEPIERITERVKIMAQNPLSVMNDEQQGVYGMASKEESPIGPETQYETFIIERAIIKIGQLLALGFGEAGS